MSALGQKWTKRSKPHDGVCPLCLQKRTNGQTLRFVRFVPKADFTHCNKRGSLFDCIRPTRFGSCQPRHTHTHTEPQNGASPAMVMRCIRRRLPGYSLSARCWVQRLSQIASDPTSQRNRQVNSGCTACVIRKSRIGRASTRLNPSSVCV